MSYYILLTSALIFAGQGMGTISWTVCRSNIHQNYSPGLSGFHGTAYQLSLQSLSGICGVLEPETERQDLGQSVNRMSV